MSAQSSNVPFSKEEGTCNGAEEELSLSYKQTKRLWKRYLKHGPKDLISKKRGRPSNYQFPPELKQDALALIKEKYFDYGPTLARKKLEEKHGLKLSKETIRQLMIKEGLWKAK